MSMSFKRKRIPETPYVSFKKAKSTKTTRSKSLTAKVNKLLLSQELKNHDVSGTVTTVAATATITALSSITVGDTANTRDGRKVLYSSIQGRYYLTQSGNTPWRVIVLYDSQPNAATPTATEVLEAPTDPNSPLSLTWSKRFTVLHDNYCGYGAQSAGGIGTTGNQSVGMCKWYKKLNLPAEYGAVAAPTTGGLLMLTLGTAVVTQVHYHRIRFTDS